jgi:hypothetical protein
MRNQRWRGVACGGTIWTLALRGGPDHAAHKSRRHEGLKPRCHAQRCTASRRPRAERSQPPWQLRSCGAGPSVPCLWSASRPVSQRVLEIRLPSSAVACETTVSINRQRLHSSTFERGDERRLQGQTLSCETTCFTYMCLAGDGARRHALGARASVATQMGTGRSSAGGSS